MESSDSIWWWTARQRWWQTWQTVWVGSMDTGRSREKKLSCLSCIPTIFHWLIQHNILYFFILYSSSQAVKFEAAYLQASKLSWLFYSVPIAVSQIQTTFHLLAVTICIHSLLSVCGVHPFVFVEPSVLLL